MKNTKRILLASALSFFCFETSATSVTRLSTGADSTVSWTASDNDGIVVKTAAGSDNAVAITNIANNTIEIWGGVLTGPYAMTSYTGASGSTLNTRNVGTGSLNLTICDPGSSGNNAVNYYDNLTVGTSFGTGTSKTTYTPKATGKTLTGFAGAMSQNLHMEQATTLATFTSLTGKVTGAGSLTLGAVTGISGDLKDFSGNLITGGNVSSLTSNLPHATLSMGHNVTYGASVGVDQAIINSLSVSASTTLNTASLTRTPVVINTVGASGAFTLTITAADGQDIYIKSSGSSTNLLSLVFTGNLGTLHLPKSWKRSLPANLQITTPPARKRFDIIG